MQIETTIHNGVGIMHISGELQLYVTPRLREALDDLMEKGINDVIIELSKVKYIDSSCLGALIGYLKKFKQADGHLILANLSESVRKILELTKLSHLFDIRATVNVALGELEKPPIQ